MHIRIVCAWYATSDRELGDRFNGEPVIDGLPEFVPLAQLKGALIEDKPAVANVARVPRRDRR